MGNYGEQSSTTQSDTPTSHCHDAEGATTEMVDIRFPSYVNHWRDESLPEPVHPDIGPYPSASVSAARFHDAPEVVVLEHHESSLPQPTPAVLPATSRSSHPPYWEDLNEKAFPSKSNNQPTPVPTPLPYYMYNYPGRPAVVVPGGPGDGANTGGNVLPPTATGLQSPPQNMGGMSHWSATTAVEGSRMAMGRRATGGEKFSPPTLQQSTAARSKTRRRVLVIGASALILLMTVIALAVGLGVTVGKKGHGGSPADGSHPDAAGAIGNHTIHPLSQLASVNFSDPDKNHYRIVAWQDHHSHIILSHYSPVDEDWTLVNVTQRLGTTVVPFAGTPLAMSALSFDDYGLGPSGSDLRFQVSVYFVDENHVLYDAVASQPDLGAWQLGQMSSASHRLVPGSSISSFWTRYFDRPSWSMVFVQLADDLDRIRAFQWNETDAWQDAGVVAQPADVSSFAAAPFFEGRKTDLSGNGTASLRLHYTTAGRVQEAAPWPAFNGWGAGRPINLAPTSNAILASCSFGSNNWVQLAVGILSRGSRDIGLSWWNGREEAWRTGKVSLLGNVEGADLTTVKITSISMTQEARAYLVTAYDEPAGKGSQLLEFTIDQSDPFTWRFDGVVKVRN